MNGYFEFINSVKILCGDGALENLAYELDFLGCKSPLLLSDEGLVKVGTVDMVKAACKGVAFNTTFTDIPADSSTLTINQIARLYNHNKCDGIVALGGGSVIDTAKGVRLMLSQKVENILTLSGNEIVKKGAHIPFVVMPTTSGTGSECTAVAVIKDANTHTKLEFISSELLPDAAILDVRLTKTLPAKLTASTAFDALVHSVEAYTSLQKNPISDVYATTAIKLISSNMFDVLDSGDTVARLNLALASNLAGTAFSNAMVGIVHAIGHACGAVSNIPHGNAMTMLLAPCMRFNLDVCHVEYSNLLLYFTNEETYANAQPNERAKLLIKKVEEMANRIHEKTGLMIKLSEYGVKEEDLEKIALKAIDDGAAIVNQKKFTKDDVIAILKEIF